VSGWAPRRFWADATVVASGTGHALLLDGKPVNTPARAPLVVPTLALAQAVAAEWMAQGDRPDPATMPLTRAANSAIDKVVPQRAAVVDAVAAYGEADLLCYRAAGPAALVARQAAAWDPLLHWADTGLGAPLVTVTGVMFQPQPETSLRRLHARVAAFDPFALTALSDLLALSGSLVIGLAVAEGRLDAAAAWEIAHIDEAWQAEQWGADAEAEAALARKRQDFLLARRLLDLIS
jgi:chaperone required for assembly of F1-ATPase